MNVKLFHTADWHLGKLVQGVYMTDDQRYVLNQFIDCIEAERPDAVIIAGDLYDRAVPPAEAVELLDEVLERIVIGLDTPVLAIAGNHDSPDRIGFGSRMMESRGLYLAGQLRDHMKPVVLRDEFGEVHVHLVPYADPAQVRHAFGDDAIRTHDDAMRAITARLEELMDPNARHIFVGHAFVTPRGEAAANTSDSERPLSIGGAEHVSAAYFAKFHYTALGHLHGAHHVWNETIRYAGSPLKYSVSEERHVKGFYAVELDGEGRATAEKRLLMPLRDMRRVTAYIEELERHEYNEDYVYVTLLNENPVLYPMEKIRAVYPNAMHVERRPAGAEEPDAEAVLRRETERRSELDPVEHFASFYREVKGMPLDDGKRKMIAEAYEALLREEGGAV